MPSKRLSWRDKEVLGLVALSICLGVTARAADQEQRAKTTADAITVYDPAEQTGTPIAAVTNEFQHHLRVLITLPDDKPQTVRVEPSLMTGPDGTRVQPRMRAAGGQEQTTLTWTIERSGLQDIDLSATLPRLGDYSGWLTIFFADRAPLVKALRINRSVPTLPIEVIASSRVKSEACFCDWRSATLWFTLQAPVDRDLTITPSLSLLERNETGQEKSQATNVEAVFAGAAKPLTAPLEVKAGTNPRIALGLKGFAAPGEYSGTLRITAANFKPLDKTFIVLVKDACWIAALLIGLGAGVSMSFKRYGQNVRPRLVIRQKIADLMVDIRALESGARALDATEQEVLDAIERQIGPTATEARETGTPPADWETNSRQALARIGDKLTVFADWVNARARVAALKNPTLGEEARKTLLDIQNALASDGAITADAQAKLRGVPGQLNTAIRADLDTRIKEFKQTVTTRQGKVSATVLNSPAWVQIFSDLGDAAALTVADDFDGAGRHFDAARLAFAKLQASDLSERIQAGLPSGAVQAEWDIAKAKIAELLKEAQEAKTTDAAVAAFDNAYRAYLAQVITPLINLAEGEIGTGSSAKKVDPAAKDRFEELVKKAAEKAKAAESLRTQSKLGEAFDAYMLAVTAWAGANELLPKGSHMGGPAQGQGEPATGGVEIPGAVGAAAAARLLLLRRRIPVEDGAALAQRTRWFDFLLDLVALVISVVLGILYVWKPSPTWGGVADYLLAFLWGLGLHQVSGFTFDGVLGLRDKLIK